MNNNDNNIDVSLNKLSIELKTEIKKVTNALSQLETDVHIIQTGDAKGSYWNGLNAYNVIKNSLLQIDQNNDLLKNLNKCSAYIDSLVKDD